jgi:hypothetical protein
MNIKFKINVLMSQILIFLFLTTNTFGVEHIYRSSWKQLPPQIDPTWGQTYTAETAAIVHDGNEYVLRLDNTTGSSSYYNYNNNEPGAGTIKDIVTIDLRFRLVDDTQDDDTPQFYLVMYRPRADSQTGRQVYKLRFSKNKIEYLNNAGAYVSVANTALGTDWHNINYVIDVENDQAELYFDSSATSAITHVSMKSTAVSNMFVIGDDSLTVGKVDIASLDIESYSTDVKFVYNADSGSYPENIDTSWYNNYGTNKSIITDGAEGNVLFLDHTITSPYYKHEVAPGSGTKDDLVTVNFRFRLPLTQAEAQFHVIVDRPRSDLQTGRQSYNLRFSNDKIEYLASSYISVDVDIGTDWHDARYIINVANDQATLYLDGSAIPVISHVSRIYTTVGNKFSFGDNSSGISGKVYFKSLSIESSLVNDALTELRLKRRQLARKPRRIIFNDDGANILSYVHNPDDSTKFPTRADLERSFLGQRTSGLENSQVDTISYCTLSASFCSFTYPTKVSIDDDGNTYHGNFATIEPTNTDRYNIVDNLTDKDAEGNYILGTGPLKIIADWSRKNGKEIFWSMRMNDTHDSGAGSSYLNWSDLKNDYPELLMDEDDGSYSWSAVKYSEQIIRDIVVAFAKEVCENYDVDGIELDFFRHLYLFNSAARDGGVATEVELAQLTEMMTEIRAMTEEVGLRKGKPLLVTVRVPDSIEYCEGIGIDLTQWLDDGLVDILIGSGYFRLNEWSYLTDLKDTYDIMVYAGLSESRINLEGVYERDNDATYRARALTALKAGVDGVYIFNKFDPDALFLDQIGDKDIMDTMDQLYFLTYRDNSSNPYLEYGDQYSAFNPEFRFPIEMDTNWYSNYGTNKSFLMDGDEGFVLALDHTSSSPYYKYEEAPGSGTKNDIVTINFRFRLPITQTEAQFQAVVNRPRADSQTGKQSYNLRFYNDKIEYLASSYVPVSIALGTDWHDARYVIDVENDQAKLYIDGVSTPVMTHASRIYTTVANNFLFGDNSSGISGKVNLKSLSIESSSTTDKVNYNVDLAGTYIRFLSPEKPVFLFPGNPIYFYPYFADISGYPTVKVALYMPNYDANQHSGLTVKFNGSLVQGAQYNDEHLEFNVISPPSGENEIKLELPSITNFNPDNQNWIYNKIFDAPDSIIFPKKLPMVPLYSGAMSVDGFLEELTINDNDGYYHFLSLPMIFDPTKTTIIETKAQVITSSTTYPKSIAIRIANGQNVEYIILATGEIKLYYAGISHTMNTSSSFHEYKILLSDDDILVYVDGLLELDGTDKFTTLLKDEVFPWINPVYAYLKKNTVSIGSFTTTGTGESKWKYIRYNSGALIINDVIVDVQY